MRHRMSRRSIWALLSVAALASTVVIVGTAAPAAAATTTTFTIQSSGFKVTGSPYTWSFSLSRSGSTPWNLGITAKRSGHNGKASQTHTWNFSVPAADVVVSANLATLKVNTHADLQGTVDYGTINLHATQRSKLKSASTKCKKTNKVLFTLAKRTGKLGGTFDFKPNAGTLPSDVVKAPIGFTASKFVNFNRNCPSGGGGGGGGGGTCTVSKSFGGSIVSTDSFFVLNASPIGKTSFMTISQSLNGATISPAVSISHAITVSGPASAVKIASNGNATIDGSVGTPFLSATTLKYVGGSSTKFPFGKCTNILYTDSYLSGSIDVKFDSGPILLDGSSGMMATTTRVVKT
ncbi:MAG TPA: hypothetical protein VK646_08855 [Actinomycetota bacterium]|nr:hypothetical protein [Actinomycetota bacterium]